MLLCGLSVQVYHLDCNQQTFLFSSEASFRNDTIKTWGNVIPIGKTILALNEEYQQNWYVGV